MSVRVPRKAQMMLERLIAARQLTPEGRDWLIAATDPFHDSELRLEGFPDITTSKSVVQTVTQTVNLATNQGTSNWDAHIFLCPVSTPFNYASTPATLDNALYDSTVTPYGDITGAQTLTPALYSGVNAIGVAAGTDWLTSVTNTALTNQLSIQVPHSYGTYRMIGCGFEVTNTTAEIYKQGSVTSYKSPCINSNCTISNASNSVINTFELGPLPPTTQAEAAMFPNSCTWAAADGVYQVCSLNKINNPFRQPLPGSGAGLVENLTQGQLSTGANYVCFIPKIVNGTPGLGNNSPQNFMFPYDISGCIFAGLSPQTTLQVTVKYYFERMPTFTDQTLLVLATPTAPFDPLALEIYSRVLDQLPVAVPVGENPMGEWFNTVLRTVSEWAPKVGSALSFIPGAGLIGTGLGMGAGALRNALYPDAVPPKPPPLPSGVLKQASAQNRKARIAAAEDRRILAAAKSRAKGNGGRVFPQRYGGQTLAAKVEKARGELLFQKRMAEARARNAARNA